MPTTKTSTAAKPATIVRGSGNVFADLEVPDAEEKQTKVRLAVAINGLIAPLSQSAAATRLGLNQPKVSALANYRLQGFSVERLLHLLNMLGCDVDIVIHRPRPRRSARTRITAA